VATQKEKSRLIDKFNEEFLNVGSNAITKDFEKFFNKVIMEASQKEKSNKELRKDIKDIRISPKNYVRESYTSVALSGITNVIEQQRLDKDDRFMLAPIIAYMAIYNRNPKAIAKKTETLTIRVLSNNTKGLNKTDRRAFEELKTYYNRNNKTIKKLIKRSRKEIGKIHRRIKSNMSKIIIKDLSKQTKERIEETIIKDAKKVVIKRPKTFQEIRKDLRDKYGKQLDFRVRRIVDTELKELQEKSKQVQHLDFGYTKKKWNTQLDAKVRQSHKKLQGQIKPIDKKFRVGAGWAMYPGDPALPAKERINERCYLTYTKG
jgi:hypothetical protein